MERLALGNQHATYPADYAIPRWVFPMALLGLRSAAFRSLFVDRFPLGRLRSYLIANFMKYLWLTFERDDFERIAGVGRADVQGYLFEIGEYSGRSGFENLLRDWGEAFPNMETELDKWVEPQRGTMVLGYRHRGVAPTSGIPVDMDPAFVIKIEAGWLTEFRSYRRAAEALEAVGLSE